MSVTITVQVHGSDVRLTYGLEQHCKQSGILLCDIAGTGIALIADAAHTLQ